eukprot:scaffold14831_cov120-Skeletonema_dohrnii-CCMP3373.AAC.4
MTLFATLTKDKASSSSCSPPEAIQLHGNKFINFLSAKTVNLDDNNDASDLRHFSALSYQAVQTQREDVAAAGSVAGTRQHLRPDLGIWDCRIQSSSSSADNTAMLLQRVIINKKGGNSSNNKKDGDGKEEQKEEADSAACDETNTMDLLPPTVVLTVDTTNPNSVQPSLEQMRHVLLSMMTSAGNDTSSSNNNKTLSSIQTTTSMKVLQSSPFGITKITESVGSSLQDSSARVAIIIAAIVASSSNDDGKSAAEEFKQRQAKSLVLYHLHKFALECDCTLCFVHDDDGTNDNGLAEGIQKLTIGDDTVEKKNGDNGNDDTNNNDAPKKSALTIDELGKVIRRVAMGLSPVVEEEDVASSSAEGESKTEEDVVEVVASSLEELSSAIHAPGSHDAELIHGAYLRNASCEGQWDASKDDLIVALPPPPQSTASNNNSQQQKEESKEGTASGGGDEEWLSKLAASVGLSPEAITTASSQGGGDAAAAATASTTPSGKKSPKRERPV